MTLGGWSCLRTRILAAPAPINSMKKITQILVLTTIPLLVLWDVLAEAIEGTPSTVSGFIWTMNAQYSILAPATGFVMGHLFSGPGQWKGLELKYRPYLRWVFMGLLLTLFGFEFAMRSGIHTDLVINIQSAQMSFVRFIIGAGTGRWIWGQPKKGLPRP